VSAVTLLIHAGWQVQVLLGGVATVIWGHAARWVERKRFRLTMWRHGYGSHGAYVSGQRNWARDLPPYEWANRRRRYIRDHDCARRGCWNCRKHWQRGWPIHHLDYSRAGGGQERERDLKFVCEACHIRFHRADRKRGLLRALGVSLRMATYLVHTWWLPVRVIRVSWQRIVSSNRRGTSHAVIGHPDPASPRETRDSFPV
jgi:hypothetical protein